MTTALSTNETSTTFFDTDGTNNLSATPVNVRLSLQLRGEAPGVREWLFVVLFDGQIIINADWQSEETLATGELPINLKNLYFQELVADKPLIFLLRVVSGKTSKDPDPLLHVDNRAGGTVDLLPLLLGEKSINVTVPLVFISTGLSTGCSVKVSVVANGNFENIKVPLVMTMISGHCLPFSKDGTVYFAAIGLDSVLDPMSVNFGKSLSNSGAQKIVWASASNAGQAANTAYNVPNEDMFIPENFFPKNTVHCRSFYWNAMKRVLIDPDALRKRLHSPLVIQLAGVPRHGKIEVRGRYMGFVDAGVLLEVGQSGMSVCTQLLFYNETVLPEGVGGLLELPTSAKRSSRDLDFVMDEYEHTAFVIVRFDLLEPLSPTIEIDALYETIGFSPPEGPKDPIEELEIDPEPEDTAIDVRRIRKEGGGLCVHNELSGLACRGIVPMNQGIKRTAANRLLIRVRTMLKQFPPENCSILDWQDLVTAQHGASRRSVTSSFAPQPPALQRPSRVAAARCRIAGDMRIADEHIQTNLKIARNHPHTLLSIALRCLEERSDIDARNYLLEALSAQVRNKYILWTYGGQEFNKGSEGAEAAATAFRIAVMGDYSDGIGNVIGWAAMHVLYHYLKNPYAAFVAAERMRKAYDLPKEWKKFYQRWIKISGEEERFWIPTVVSSQNPMLITAAFFLCLRCYKFTDYILLCYENECATLGSRYNLKTKISQDLYYLRATSFLLRRQYDKASDVTKQGIKMFGPSAIMSQMRTSILLCTRGWDVECENALKETERFSSQECPAILLRAALGTLKTNPKVSLQRAARAHKIAPWAHSGLIIGRIYKVLGEDALADRWAAAAIKLEPTLADGWAFISLLAMYEMSLDKARIMLRTAKQAGPISRDIEEEIKIVSEIIKLEILPDSLVKKLCLCDYM